MPHRRRLALELTVDLVGALLLAICLFVLAARYTLPQVAAWRAHVESWASEALGQPVRVAAIEAGWRGLDPQLVLHQVTLLDAAGAPRLEIDSVRAGVDLSALLFGGRVRFGHLHLDGLALTLDASGTRLGFAGFQRGAEADPDGGTFAAWLLGQPRVDITSARLALQTANGPAAPLADIALSLANDGERYRFSLQWRQPGQAGDGLNLDAEFRGDPRHVASWRGRLHARARGLPWQALLGQLSSEQLGVTLPAAITAHPLPGLADGEAWLELDTGVQRFVGDLVLRSDGRAPHAALRAASGRFDWRPGADGWRLDLARVSLDGGTGAPLWLGAAALESRGTAGQESYALGLASLPLVAARELVLASGWLPAPHAGILRDLAPRGELFNPRLLWQPAAPGRAATWRVRGEALQVALAAWRRWPGFDGLSGTFDLGPERGTLELHSRALAIELPWLFREPLAGLRVDGHGEVWRDADGWHLAVPQLAVANPDLVTLNRLRLDLPAGGGAPFIDLVSSYRDGNGARTRHYLPTGIMGPRTIAWLDRAFGSGRVTQGGLVVHGPLDAFPYDHGEGRFQVRFQVVDQALDYLAGWPRIEQIAGWVEFDGRAMQIAAREARMFSARLHDVAVTVADLTASNPELRVHGHAAGPFADGLRYLRESPLRPLFGDYLAVSRGAGPIGLELALVVPLASGATRVDGTLELQGNTLTLPDFGMRIEALEGRLDFTRTGLQAQGLDARWAGMPVKIEVEVPARGVDGRGGTLISAFGQFQPEAPGAALPPAFAARLRGATPWRASVRTFGREGGLGGEVSEVHIRLDSTLAGLAVDLPAPLGKPAEPSRDLALSLRLAAGRPAHFDARYGQGVVLGAALARRDGAIALDAAELRLDGGDPVLPAAGERPLRIRGERLELAAWWPVITGLRGAVGTGRGMPGLVLDFARLGVTDELLLEQAQVTLDEAAEQWVIGVVSRQAGGRVVLPKQWGPAGLVKVDLDYLVLPDSEAAGEAPQPPGHGADPREQPNLMLHVRRLSHGDRPVGELLLRTVTLANGLGVEELLLTGDGWRVDGSGRWAWREDTPYTELELEFSSSALDTLLHSLGYDGQFERAPTSASLVIDWPGSPDRFSRRTLGGRLDIDVGEGVIRDLAPGAGRVFGLINLAQIGRRVRLDFSDLTERGLAFDAIRGHFLIDEGNAYTNDLALTGPAVEISVMGRIGLVRRDYDELVTVVPQVSGSLPIAGAMLGGPAVGAALLVFDRLLGEQVNRLSQVQYTLTGSWDDPRLERFKGLPEPVSSPP